MNPRPGSGTGAKQWFVLAAVGIGTFLSTLSNSSMNTILPYVQKDLGIGLAQAEWLLLIYLLVLSLFLLPLGRMADLIGYKSVLLGGFGLFTVATIGCGLSRTYPELLLGRGLLAVGGAAILAVGPALLTHTFAPEHRGKVLGLQAVMTYVGLSVGPAVGGWLTDWYGWHHVFYANAPVSLAGIVLGTWAIRVVTPVKKPKFDPAGMILLMLALSSFLVLLNPAAVTGGNPIAIGFVAAVGLGSLLLFIRVEWNHPFPTLQLRLFRLRNFLWGTIGAIMNYLGFFVILFVLPYYFDRVIHAPPSRTGMFLSIMPVAMAVGAPLSGGLSDRIGVRVPTVLGMTLSVCGLVMFGFLAGSRNTFLLLGALVVTGLGTGIFAAPNNSAILGSAPRDMQGVASGVLATARYLGMMLGTTMGGTLFDWLNAAALAKGTGTLFAFVHSFQAVVWMAAGVCLLGIGASAMLQPKPIPGQSDL